MNKQGGFTIVEVMVSMLLVGIAAAFVFSIQVRASGSFRDQATIAEEQQTLRSASDLISRDLRQAGYYAIQLQTKSNGSSNLRAVTVTDNANGTNAAAGTDILGLQYGDTLKSAKIAGNNPLCTDTDTIVASTGGFVNNDKAFAVHLDTKLKYAWGCLFQITNVDAVTPKLQHPTNSIYNSAASGQCSNLCDVWGDGHMVVVGAVLRAYRIKPADRTGVLQMSKTGGIESDWEDLAVGIIDLQAAIRVYQPGDTIDEDGDGDPERDWFSGSNMSTVLTSSAELLNVSVTLVAKSNKEVNGALASKSPDVLEAGKPVANNSIGDHAGTTLPVSDATSMFYGKVVYRSYTQTVDLRNVGINN